MERLRLMMLDEWAVTFGPPLNLFPPEQIFLKYLDPSEKLIFVPTIKVSVMKANQCMSAVLMALRLVSLILLATGSLQIMAERNAECSSKTRLR